MKMFTTAVLPRAGVVPGDIEPLLAGRAGNPPVITVQPVGDNYDGITPVTLSVTATGDAPLTYQWYEGVSGDTSTPIMGATASTYDAEPVTETSYWVRVSNGVNPPADSDTAVVAIDAPVITVQPVGGEYDGVTPVTLSVTATGAGLTYQWSTGPSGTKDTEIPGATSSTYDAAPGEATEYYCTVTNEGGAVDSDSAMVTVPLPPEITTQPQAGEYDGVTPYQLEVVATGDGLTYQWYKGASGDTGTPIGGATAATYDAEHTDVIQQSYWCRVSNDAGDTDSDAAIVTFAPTTLPFAFKCDLDADVGVTVADTDKATAWANQGTVGFSCTNDGGTNRPNVITADADFNGHNSLEFTGTQYWYQNGGAGLPVQLIGVSAKSIFTVCKADDYTGGATLYADDGTKFRERNNGAETGLQVENVSSGSRVNTPAAATPATGTVALIEALHDGSTISKRVNDGAAETENSGTTDTQGTYINIGTSNGSANFRGKITRRLMHNAEISEADRMWTRAYLSKRYGLGLAA